MATTPLTLPPGMEITGAVTPELAEILAPGALKLVARLEREFGGRRRQLLQARVERQKELDSGRRPDFLASTKLVRDSA